MALIGQPSKSVVAQYPPQPAALPRPQSSIFITWGVLEPVSTRSAHKIDTRILFGLINKVAYARDLRFSHQSMLILG
jgi:hypothetical protein